MLEVKAEVKTEDTEPDASESKGEPGSSVGAVPGREQVRGPCRGHLKCPKGKHHGFSVGNAALCFNIRLMVGSERI